VRGVKKEEEEMKEGGRDREKEREREFLDLGQALT
jgi:hypothetical protein